MTRDQLIEQFLADARRCGYPLIRGKYVREHDAAKLIGYEASTLKNWRFLHQPIPFDRPGGGRRIYYCIDDLATFWLANRPDPPETARIRLDAEHAPADDAPVLFKAG